MNQDQQNASQEPTQPQEQQPITAPDARPPEQLPPENTPVVVKAKKSKKGWFGAILVVLVLLGAGALYWFVFRDNNQTQAPVVDKNSESASSAEIIPSAQEADTLSYAFANTNTTASDIYWRPASGGERTKVSSLSGTERPSQFDVNGQNVAYVVGAYSVTPSSDAGVWYSSDSGKTFTKIYSLMGEEQVTSIKFATDSNELVIAFLPQTTGKNTVKSIDLSSKATKDLFVNEEPAVFLKGYSADKQKIVYEESACFNCGGGYSSTLHVYDIAKKTSSKLVDIGPRVIVGIPAAVAVDHSFENIAYISADETDAARAYPELRGPYYIEQKNIATGEVERLAEFGSASDVDKFTSLGYPQSNTNQNPYFSYDTKLYRKYDKGPVVVYEAVKPILRAYYVSDSVVIASSGTYADFLLSRYDIATKTASTLLSGDANTTIFGVTTK